MEDNCLYDRSKLKQYLKPIKLYAKGQEEDNEQSRLSQGDNNNNNNNSSNEGTSENEIVEED